MAKKKKLGEFVSILDALDKAPAPRQVEIEDLANYAIAKVDAIGNENLYFITEDGEEIYIKQGDWHPAKLARLLLPISDRLFNQAMEVWQKNPNGCGY